jgi:hypothetical protein
VLIRYGYEITLNCAQPTALICLLSVHDDHAKAIRVPERVFTTPIIPTTTYRDLFGNRCRRLVAPAGDLTLWGDATDRGFRSTRGRRSWRQRDSRR